MQIFNRRLISRNTTHRQSLHLIQSESKCCGCVYKVKKDKHPKKRKKQKPTENQKNTKYQNVS